MIPSPPKTFFISDLHLSRNTKNVALLFDYFLKSILKPQDTLYILGDFFEYWLGEDLLDETQQAALIKLKTLNEQGSAIFFMPGNRDFLIRAETLKEFGITLLPDPYLLDAKGKKLLLTHGDALCTNDLAYQRYKKWAYHPLTKWIFLKLPRKIRGWLAEKIHNKNPHGAFIKDPNYTLADATPLAINQLLSEYQPDFFIYGHVHQMKTEQSGKTTIMVLGDWYHTGNYIEWSETGFAAKEFSL